MRSVGRLTENTADYPFLQGVVVAAVERPYRVGRRADALGAFEHARRLLLVENLGV